MKHARAFVEALRNESLGFAFSEPWRFSERSLSCIIPIIRTRNGRVRNYITYVESKKAVVTDAGRISPLPIKNDEDVCVYIRVGEIFKGATQERISVGSVVLKPGESKEIEVRCGHRSKGINLGTKFSSGGYAPSRDDVHIRSLHRTGSGAEISQQDSWRRDQEYIHNYCCTARGFASSGPQPDTTFNLNSLASDDLFSAVESSGDIFKEIFEKIPHIDNQVGFVLMDDKGVYLLDCYDISDSWSAIREAMCKKESLKISDIAKEGEIFEIKFHKEKTTDKVKELLGSGFKENILVDKDGVQVTTFEFTDHIGEAVVVDDVPIHLLIARKGTE